MLKRMKAKQEHNEQSSWQRHRCLANICKLINPCSLCAGETSYADKCIHTELMKGLRRRDQWWYPLLLDQTIAFYGGLGERSALLGGAARLRSGWTTGKAPADTVWPQVMHMPTWSLQFWYKGSKRREESDLFTHPQLYSLNNTLNEKLEVITKHYTQNMQN